MKTIYSLTLLALFFCSSCKKLIRVDAPDNQLISDKVFSDSTAVLSALTNIYSLYGRSVEVNFSPQIGLYGDEISVTNTAVDRVEFQLSLVSPSNTANLTIWKNQYLVIYACNDLIENLPIGGLPENRVNQWLSEAKFLRAYSYYLLVNLYDNVPLILSTNVDLSRSATQNTKTEVYNQINTDLLDAKRFLTSKYEGQGKVRANYFTVLALQCRMAMASDQWVEAERISSEIIMSGLYTPLENLDNVFRANSRESIFQFQPQNGFVAGNGTLVPASNTTLPTYVLNNSFISAVETGDQRFTKWTGSSTVSVSGNPTIYRYPFKYKNRIANTGSPENLTLFRLAEQFLNRAEARAKLNNPTGALEDLNIVRRRAGMNNISVTSKDQLLAQIYKDRRVELFMEWGIRFFDLKRLNQLGAAIAPLKSTWRSSASALPIPNNELLYNTNLKQNQGYTN